MSIDTDVKIKHNKVTFKSRQKTVPKVRTRGLLLQTLQSSPLHSSRVEVGPTALVCKVITGNRIIVKKNCFEII